MIPLARIFHYMSNILESKVPAQPVAAAMLALLVNQSTAAIINIAAPETGVSVRLDAGKGDYAVSAGDLDWTFAGSFKSPLTRAVRSQGKDSVGNYQQVSFAWNVGTAPMTGWIRLYSEQPLALFSQTCGSAVEFPPAAFPAFTKLPAKLHVLSHGLHEFAPPQFSASEISTPWLLFDDRANAVIISPASHFMVASMIGDGTQLVASGFNPKLRNLPPGFTQQTLVAFSQGIGRTYDAWGHGMLALQQAKRPANDADAVLKYLGYWTDNGAYYYYNYDLDKGYAGTMQALVQSYRQQQIPIRYLQLDSWWYSKSTTDADGTPGKSKKVQRLPEGEWNRYGGTLAYKASPYLFTNGLDAFQQSIGMPLVTHARWIDPASPYHEQYQSSGLAMVDPKWWDDIAAYLKSSGVATYEQDWLDRIYNYSPAFSSNADTAEVFLDNMARACRENGITLQYCMPYAAHFMQGCKYENLTTIRASGDRFNLGRWNNFLYTSHLAAALGIWPWTDVFKSGETGNVLLATLSAGPVGIGDAMGAETMINLQQSVRTDGVIIKPDAPIVPLDRSYIADAQHMIAPMIAGTHTRHGGITTAYIFAFRRPKTPESQVEFSPAEVGFGQPAYVYDYFTHTGQLIPVGGKFSASLPDRGLAFYVVAPVGKSGIAFLGDRDKFVGTGRQRISSLQDSPGQLNANIVFAENETAVTLAGYARLAPKVSVQSGQAGTVQFDPATRYFSVEVKCDPGVPTDNSSGDPIRQATVVLNTSGE
jgi:hypothetical protein